MDQENDDDFIFFAKVVFSRNTLNLSVTVVSFSNAIKNSVYLRSFMMNTSPIIKVALVIDDGGHGSIAERASRWGIKYLSFPESRISISTISM